MEFPPFNKLVNPSFAPLFENKDRYILCWGSRISAKSTSVARILIYRCLTEKHFKWVLRRKYHHSIKDSLYQTLKEEIEILGLQDLFTFKVSPLEIICNNGNKFVAKGSNKPYELINDLTGAWYEEANEMTKDEFLSASYAIDINNPKAEFIQEIFTFNPETEGNYEDFWMWKMFFEGHAEKSFRSNVLIEYMVDGEKKIVHSNYTVHHSTYMDNQHVTDQQKNDLENLKSTNKYYHSVFTRGDWANIETNNNE